MIWGPWFSKGQRDMVVSRRSSFQLLKPSVKPTGSSGRADIRCTDTCLGSGGRNPQVPDCASPNTGRKTAVCLDLFGSARSFLQEGNTKLPLSVNSKDGDGKMLVERNPLCSVRKIIGVREIYTHVLFIIMIEKVPGILSHYCHTLVVWICSHSIGSEVSKVFNT